MDPVETKVSPVKPTPDVEYYGYMDTYFQARPPIPVWNVIVNNTTLEIVENRQGQW